MILIVFSLITLKDRLHNKTSETLHEASLVTERVHNHLIIYDLAYGGIGIPVKFFGTKKCHEPYLLSVQGLSMLLSLAFLLAESNTLWYNNVFIYFFLDVVQKPARAPDMLAVATPPDVPTDKRMDVENTSQLGEWHVRTTTTTTTSVKWSVSFSTTSVNDRI